MAEIQINGKPYEHKFFHGEVVGATKQLETKVSGGGGGGATFRGTGMTRSVKIRSTTVTHDMVHLADETGAEHALRLQDWDLSVREGHDLTAVWLIKRGRKKGPYVTIHNHTLGETVYHHKALAKMHRSLWILLGSLALFFVLPFGTGVRLALVAAGLAAWWYLGIRGKNQLIASGDLLRLAGVQPAELAAHDA